TVRNSTPQTGPVATNVQSVPDNSVPVAGLAVRRVIVAAVGGSAAAALALRLGASWSVAALSACDVAALVFVVWVWLTVAGSDTDLTGKRIRRVALQHALLAYLFGTVIVAIAVSSVAALLGR